MTGMIYVACLPTGKHARLALAVLAVLASCCSKSMAASFEPPPWAGQPGTEFSGWLNFSQAFNAPNHPDDAGGAGDATLTQTTPGAIVTGGGNIYNPAGANRLVVADAVDVPLRTVVFQSWTVGTELNYDSVVLEYDDGEVHTLTATREELAREAGGQGDTVVSRWTWDVSALNLTKVTIRAAAQGAHNSLASARLDLRKLPFAVPAFYGERQAGFAGWMNFTTAVGANSPDVTGSTSEAVLAQTTPGAIVTSTSNIYNPAGVSVFEVSDSRATSVEQVVFQAWTTGTELDYATLVLEYESGGAQTLAAVREELLRVGSEVVSKWSWDLTGLGIQSFTIRVSAAGAHTSLVAARLDLLAQPPGVLIEIARDSSDLDRWNYPFNATPGTRTTAPVFKAGSETGIDRHGHYVIGFDTGSLVKPGHRPGNYIIESARLTATTTSNFEAPYDPSYDSVFTYLPEAHGQRVADTDTGRPVELYGVGFRNGFEPWTWEDAAPYAPTGGERSVFPAVMNESGSLVDAIEAVNFASPRESSPLAVGAIDTLAPGALIPGNTPMTFELDVESPAVQAYLQSCLSHGRVFFAITCLEDDAVVSTRPYPEFATRHNLVYDPPQLEMTVRFVETLDIRSLALESEGGRTIRFPAGEGVYRIRYTDDFQFWQEVTSPTLTFPQPGVGQWTDDSAAGARRFYQVYLEP